MRIDKLNVAGGRFVCHIIALPFSGQEVINPLKEMFGKCDNKPRSGYIEQILRGYRDRGFDEAESQSSEWGQGDRSLVPLACPRSLSPIRADK